MKRLIVGIGMSGFLMAGAAGQTPTPKYGVTVKAEKNVDFAKFRTYSWTTGQPSADKMVDARVVAAVDRELGALGLTKVAAGPGDVLAAYYSVGRTDVNLKGKPDAKGSLPQYSVGTLIVALLDPGSRQRLLQLRADQPIESDPAKLGATIDGVVTTLFAEYPTRRHK